MNHFLTQRNFLLCVLVCLVTAAGAMAQNTGSLEGSVVDPSGAKVAGAAVTLTDIATQVPRTAQTGASGEFGFVQLNPGAYRLEVALTGFRTHVEEHVTVVVATPTRVEIHLELGSMNQEVLVESSDVPQLNTVDATVGNPFEEKEVKDLPFLARNVVNLLTLQPGVVFTGMSDTDKLSQGSIATLDPREGAVDGVRGNQSNITVDGIDANDWQNQAAFTSALPVTLDSVQEFRVTTTNANATDGVVGGPQVALVTKSGSNDFHGNVRWYYRTSGPVANDFFSNSSGIPKGKDQRNIAGGSLGGRIIKDRLFFFLDNEERREAVSASIATPRQVPSDALRHGVLIYDCTGDPLCPATPTSKLGADGTMVSVPAGDYGLSATQFQQADPAKIGVNPAILDYFKLIPEGNDGVAANDGLNGLGAFNGLNFTTVEPTNINVYTSRIDYILTKNGHHSIFWKGTLEGLKAGLQPPEFPGQQSSSELLNNSRGIAVQYQAQLTPTIINTARYGLTRIGVTQSGVSGTRFNIRSFSDLLDYGARPEGRTVPVHEINDDLSWSRGRHTWTMGGAIYFVRNHNVNDKNSFPFVGINNGFCLNLCGDYDLSAATGANAPAPADPTSFVRAFTALTGSITEVAATVFATPQGTFLPPGSPEDRHFSENLYETYFQDSWKVKPNVTLTLGLRWGYEAPPYETGGFQVRPTVDIGKWFAQREINAFNGIPSNASPILSWDLAGKANHGRNSWFAPDYKNFAPRVALAYSPGFSSGLLGSVFGGPGKTSIRLGAGIFYDRIGQALALDSDQNGSPGTATGLTNGSQQFTLADAPRFSGTCSATGCTGLPAIGPPFFPLPSTATFPFTPDANPKDQAPGLGFAVDPNLRTPYTIHLTASVQRQLSKNVVLDVGYVGTLGRRLLGKADFAQYENLRDTKSGVDLFTAYRQIAALAQATPSTFNGPAIDPTNFAQLATIKPIAYFTDLLPNMPAFTAAALGNSQYASLTPTQAFYAYTATASGAGFGAASWSCALYGLDTTQVAKGRPTPWNSTLDPTGTGFVLFQQQFSQLDAWTNWANSNYHSLQVTVKKNVGFGTFAFNYVFSKSIDNDSTGENGDLIPGLNGTAEGLIQNPFNLRLNRGPSDFNLTHNFNGSGVVELPFGHGKKFASGAGRIKDAVVGGWEITSAMRWRSGFPLSPGNGFNFPTNFFLTSNSTLIAPLKSSLTRNVPTLPGLPGSPNLFSNPQAALADLAFTLPGLPGSRNVLSGPGYASLDMGAFKTFRLWSEASNIQFRVTAFNVFNSVNFADTAISLDPTSPGTFGQITATTQGAFGRSFGREMEFAIRLSF